MKHYRTLLLVLCLAGGCNSQSTQTRYLSSHEVATKGGVAVGTESSEGVILWQDIPYATAPIGNLRWRAPRPIEASTRTIPTGDGSVACLQETSTATGTADGGIEGTEDCLYLDIRAPAVATEQPRPVMLWVHGGGNTSGNKGYYDFSDLVTRQDVIVVTFNYRLGPLGWFTHPAIQSGQTGLDSASNFGTLDIIQALRWVKENVAGFGGDADNITVFGESAGGHNIYALLASPLATGLFHKAIMQSGYVTSSSLADAYNVDASNQHVARSSWQLSKAVLPQLNMEQATAEQLRSIPGKKLLKHYYELDSSGYVPLSTADGVVIPREGMRSALANPEYAKSVPVLTGTNRDEVTLWLGVHRYFVDASYPFTRLLPPRLRLKDPELYRYWVGVRSLAWKLISVDEPLEAMENAGYPASYAYRFDWDDQETSFFADFPAIVGAAHGTDVSFVTGDFRYGPVTSYIYPEGEKRDQLQRTMMRAWAGFARSGKPETSDGLVWPAYSSANRQFLHLDTDENLRLGRELQTLDSLLQQVATASSLDTLQKCLLVWDSLTKVGDPDYQAYSQWNGGQCATVNAVKEQRAINARLRRKYGSENIL